MRSKKLILVKNLFIILFIAAIYGCNGQATTPDHKNDLIASPALTASGLSPIEIRHYRTEVESFIDSAFGHRPFNGSILVAKNGEVLPIDEVAHAAGTLGYELMCGVAPRVPMRAA